jgi:hypothetical protein
MNVKNLILFSIITLFSQLCLALDGRFEITGQSSKYGPYAGQGWISDNKVQRLVRFTHYKHEQDAVETIWTGVVDGARFNFSLALSNTLTAIDNYAPAEGEFKNSLLVSIPVSGLSGMLEFALSGEEFLQEKWVLTDSNPGRPLWSDLRVSVVGVGEETTFMKTILKLSGLSKVIDRYRELPQLAPYKNREEFTSRNQYFISDKTDADFYLKNQNVLRISNKTINPLSLAEANMRRNAYGKTLAQKAQFLGEETIRNNLNSAGILEDALVNESNEKIGRRPEYDTALWSAMFGWAELLRFQVTKDPSALQNFKSVLNAVLTLLEITNDPLEFARGLAISPPQEDLGEGWIQGSGEFAQLKYRQGGNNDMIKGVFITMILAHQVIGPEEVELLNRIKKNAKHLSGLSAVKDRDFNLGIARGIEALWNRDGEALEETFSKIKNLSSAIVDFTELGNGFFFGGVADWSGIHLTMISNMSQLLMAQELETVFPEKKLHRKAEKLRASAEEKLTEMGKTYKSAHRDFFTLMLYAFVPKLKNDANFALQAQEALWTLKEVPAPRFQGHAEIELSKHPHWSASAWPRLPWKAMKGFRRHRDDYKLETLIQGAYAYPHFEQSAWSTTYFWKDLPFGASYRSHTGVQTFSADYLLVYWAGRVSGLISTEL